MAAATLKDDGNKLFAQKKFFDAVDKYTAAINLDGSNAVLYANRAACYLNMKEYLNAASDASQATTIDPKYAKAYARLATAHDMLSEHWHSVKDWQNALDNLPPGDDKTRDQYTAGLCSAQAALGKLHATGDHSIMVNSNTMTMPWVAARMVLPGLVMRRENRSSAWVIHEAYQEFNEAMNGMKQTKEIGGMLVGSTGHLAALTNAILMDERVFHMTDNNFISNYNRQVQFEATRWKVGSWTTAGANRIKTEAITRLQAEGWDVVRPMLSTTIRCWIMRSFVDGMLRMQRQAQIEFLLQALNVLEWGRETWANVNKDERGAIFQRTFVRGVRNMLLHALMESQAAGLSDSMEELLRHAEEQIRDIDENPEDAASLGTPGSVLVFHDYCKGHAYGMKGFYYNQKGNKNKKSQEGMDAYREAYKAYYAGAGCFPADDEIHTWFLNTACQALWSCHGALREQLPVMEKMEESVPQMMKIWKYSSMAQGGRDKMIQMTLDVHKEFKAAIVSGKATLDDRLSAEFHN